ncbi:hypothetical protein GGX14DRAFT_573028 [Mycena pura]|uniref:Uncharacterized protein n=1 Tax=Mycena pura TaxID=153505 RepID=A0AAD6UZP0_9AGAR|nr:hypothetical protein GGX14DRAFT_573028 [Mycena pura]
MPPGRQQVPSPRKRTPLFIPDSDDEDILTSRPPPVPRTTAPPSVTRQEGQVLTSSSPGVPSAFAPLDSGGPSRDMRTYARILASRRAQERQNRPPPDPNRYRLPRMMATMPPEYVAAQARRAARRAEGKPSSSESNESDGESDDDSDDDSDEESSSSSSEPASSESSATRSPTPPLPVVDFQDDTPPVSPAHSPAPPARSPSPPVRPPTPPVAPVATPAASSAPAARALDAFEWIGFLSYIADSGARLAPYFTYSHVPARA